MVDVWDQFPNAPTGQAAKDIWDQFPDAPSALPKQDPRITALQEPGVAQRILRGVPGLGGLLDEIGAAADAGISYVTGGRSGEDYDTALARRRQAMAKSDAENPALNTTLAVGGGIALAPNLPVANVFTNPVAPTVLTRGADAALNAAGYAALSGFTEGEGGLFNRLENAREYGGTGAMVGGVLGGTGQAVANRIGQTPANSVARQAEDIGVTVPTFMEGGRASQNIAGKLGAIPFVGDDINTAVARTRTQTAEAAHNISARAAGGRVMPQQAGEAVSQSSIDWTTGAAREAQNRLYGAIERHMTGVTAPLSATRRAATELVRQSHEAASPLHATALDAIQDALERPNGLSYEGISRLRTQIGRMVDNSIDPSNATARSGLSSIYAALTDDMQTAVTTRGGARAQQLWQRANTVARQAAERRDTVARLVGAEGDKAGEGIVDRLVAMASSKSSADATRLGQVRRAAGPDSWRQLAGTAIERLGRNQSNQFSADIFLRNYSQLSDRGRQLLFNSTGNNLIPDLDRLAAVSARLQQFNRLGNPSGSGGVGALLAALAGAGAGDAGATAGSMLAGRGVGWLMSRPAVVRQASQHAARLEAFLRQRVGRAALAGSSAALARAAAAETGEDPHTIQARIEALH